MKKIGLVMAGILLFAMAKAQLKEVSYQDAGQNLKGLANVNAGKGAPGVLILPAWMGIDEEAKTAANTLAAKGYQVFIADIYGEGNAPKNAAEAGKLAGKYKEDFQAYQKRIALALAELKKSGADSNRLAVIGYCFGGTGALEAARANLPVKGVVSIHGGLSKGSRPNGPLKTKVLVLHGAADESVSATDILNFRAELDEAHADWQMIYYAQAKHTFTNPESPDYIAIAAQRSWAHLELFLAELFN